MLQNIVKFGTLTRPVLNVLNGHVDYDHGDVFAFDIAKDES